MKKHWLIAGMLLGAFAALPTLVNAEFTPKGRQLHGWGAGTVNDPTTDEAFIGLIICKLIPGELNPITPKPNSDGDPTTGDEDSGGICDLDCRNTAGTADACAISVNEKLDGRGVAYNVCFDTDKDGFYICPFPKVFKSTVIVAPPGHVPSLFVSASVGNPAPVKYEANAAN